MTDAGYVAAGYGVTVVAIGAYVGHIWARNRALARLTAPRSGQDRAAVATAPDEGRP